MHKKTVLITGSLGNIGGVLMKGLADEYDLWGLDRREGPSRQYAMVDIADHVALRSAFQNFPRFDAVIHLAANPRPEAEWESVLHANIVGTHNLYECAREFGISRIVFASTNRTMFMHEADHPRTLKVQDPVRPDGDYAVSKVFGEALARSYHDRFGIASICLRIGSVLPDDNPVHSPRNRKTWLSHRDCVQLFQKSLETRITFGIYFGVSNNTERFWDISDAERDLDYHPVGNAATFNGGG